MLDAKLNVGQRHRWRANINSAFVFYLNRPKRLKNKQKTATRHTGTLKWGTPQALVLANVGPLSTTLAQNYPNIDSTSSVAGYNEGRCHNMFILHAGPLATTLVQQ